MSDDCLEQMKQAIMERKPRIVLAYASTIVALAKYMKRTGNPKQGFSLKSVLTMSESISDGDRKLAENVFGCTVYRRYSNMEMGILGQDMGNGSDYHLNWGSYYFECLKLDSDEPAKPNEIGRIVVTDLFNFAFPMIRYDTGDLGVMESAPGEWPVLKDIFGRRVDSVYDASGALINPYSITNSMWGIEYIKQWQFLQTDFGMYTIKVNSDDGEVNEKHLIAILKNILGISSQIAIEYVEEIPVLASGKRKYITNKMER